MENINNYMIQTVFSNYKLSWLLSANLFEHANTFIPYLFQKKVPLIFQVKPWGMHLLYVKNPSGIDDVVDAVLRENTPTLNNCGIVPAKATISSPAELQLILRHCDGSFSLSDNSKPVAYSVAHRMISFKQRPKGTQPMTATQSFRKKRIINFFSNFKHDE